MATNGEVTLYYETFGADSHPVLLLVNGLGSQCINYKVEFCARFAAKGFRIVRMDNRDVGLSSHFAGGPHYTAEDMAEDCFAVLDSIGAQTAHVAGWSMGGVIVQLMAIKHPERILSMTSVMSSPSRKDFGRDPDVLAAFNAPAARTREEAVERHLAGLRVWGSPASYDEARLTADAIAAFDRSFDPRGRARQSKAVAATPSRLEALRRLTVPTLVVHGDADRLVPLEAGRATAEAVPGACFEIVEGMGHDYPPEHWDRMVDLITTHAFANTRGVTGMTSIWVESVGRGFQQALDLLAAAVRDCTDEVWNESMWEVPGPDAAREVRGPGGTLITDPTECRALVQLYATPWGVAWHALERFDFQLTGGLVPWEIWPGFGGRTGFTPPPVRSVCESPYGGLDITTISTPWSRADLLGFTDYCRQRAVDTLTEVTPEKAATIIGRKGRTYAWTLMRTTLHVVEHAAQIRQFITAGGVTSNTFLDAG